MTAQPHGTRQEWCADEVAARLIARGQYQALHNSRDMEPVINAGTLSTFLKRHMAGLSKWRRARFIRKSMMGKALGDSYLRFIVNELKPHIDSIYSTYSDRENTFIMGASMGGLISAYAMCEYPGVFGGAGCLSTHLPMKGVNFLTRNDNRIARAFRNYLRSNLPSPGAHRIYFAYGTKTLDKWYEPYQKKVDAIMAAAGYEDGKQWITRKFEGDDHSEKVVVKKA
ncbi:MAG: alpha/beta hydrolase-fold protein [Marinilabiliales bacterium]|nr:alpha/beta hydrolase-fold protein [Marinilabiliales bacterium]